MKFTQWLWNPAPFPRRVGLRRPAPGCTALQWNDTSFRQHTIRDISATGIYLVTNERWPQGTQMLLTLHRTGAQGAKAEDQITLSARVVRWGEDGVGLALNLPQAVDPRLWVNLVEIGWQESAPDDLVSPFKYAKALSFLTRICAASGSAARNAVREGLSSHRRANIIEIALMAENLVAAWPDTEAPCAQPGLIVRILQDGSWADDELVQQCWAGLLATACAGDTLVERHLRLANLLSQLTAMHIHVFTSVCTKAGKILLDDGTVAALHLDCTPDELMKFSGSRDPQRIDRDLEHISDFGLLEKRIKSSFFVQESEINVTPTSLGLELHARCHGHHGSLQDFYGPAPHEAETLAVTGAAH
ncbi:MAG: PilZ domain-containing protein [Terracidiphilus sp.]